MRSNMPNFGKRTPFTRGHFAEFEKAYGEIRWGRGSGRIRGRGGAGGVFRGRRSLSGGIIWMLRSLRINRPGIVRSGSLKEEIAAQILALLRTATEEIEALQGELTTSVVTARKARNRRMARSDDLPAQWTMATVGDLARYINGLPFKPTDWEREGRPIIQFKI